MTQPFKIARIFDAPLLPVWRAWSDAEQLKAWFGPKGFPITYSKLIFRPDGTYHYGMQTPTGTMWGRWTFREIAPQERLVFIVSFTDEQGDQITRHPWVETWPLEVLCVVQFTERSGQTEIIVNWQPMNASAEELKTFDEGHDSMRLGWESTFEQLAAFLAVR